MSEHVKMEPDLLALVRLVNAPEGFTGDADADKLIIAEGDSVRALPSMAGLVWKKVPAYAFMPVVWRESTGGLIFPAIDEARSNDEVIVPRVAEAEAALREQADRLDGTLPLVDLLRLALVVTSPYRPILGNPTAPALEAFAPYYALLLLGGAPALAQDAEPAPEAAKGPAIATPLPRTASGLESEWMGHTALLVPRPDDLSPLYASADVLASSTLSPALLAKGIASATVPSRTQLRVFFVAWRPTDATTTSVPVTYEWNT